MRHDALIAAHRDPLASAKLARVTYQLDDVPGISRLKKGKNSFIYTDVRGKQLKNERELARIDALRIPPAWQEVWISPSSRGHLQATGLDKKGTKQYLYHPRYREVREMLKFTKLIAFADALPSLRKAIVDALKLPEPTKEKVAAAALRLIDELAIRVGSEAYAKENDTYGVTTLKNRHVNIEGDTIALSFIGKSGKEHELELTDKALAEILVEEKEMPGNRLFQYIDKDGLRHPLTAGDVNTFIKEATGGEFTAKDFRTWTGTVLAYEHMRDACKKLTDNDRTEKGRKKSLSGVMKCVAEKLGNTVAVCRAHYVHADLQKAFSDGSFEALLSRLKRAKKRTGLDKAEWEVALLLELFAKERAKEVVAR